MTAREFHVVPGRVRVSFQGEEWECFSVLIDRVELHDPLFMLHTLSHDANDFNHRHAQSCIGTK